MGLIYKGGKLEGFNQTMQEEMSENLKEGDIVIVKVVKYSDNKFRTILQNASIHLYFTKLAKALNDGGLDFIKVLSRKEVNIPWNLNLVKEYLWRDIMIAVTGKTSTTQMKTGEVSEVYDVLSHFLAERLGVVVEFPSQESQSYE